MVRCSMIRKLLLAAILLSVFASCRSYRHIYSPSPANNPFFTTKGDNQLGAFYSGGDGGEGTGSRDQNEGYDVQAAYAISDHFALTSSYYFRKERDLYSADYYDTSTVNYKRKLFDIGVGYFIPFDRGKTATFNLYGGIGFGSFTIDDRGLTNMAVLYQRNMEAKMLKWYLQPSINFLPSKNIKIGLVGRFSFVRYSNIITNYNGDEQSYFFLDQIQNKTIGFFEPSVNLQFGIPQLDWLRIESAFGAATKWKENLPANRSLNASIGLVARPFK